MSELKKNSLPLIQTKDGSYTLHHHDLNEHYHSIHGALTESLHIFLSNGLDYVFASNKKKTLYVFEMGFGTGLNACLAYLWACYFKQPIQYISIEKYPISPSISLAYLQCFSNKNFHTSYYPLSFFTLFKQYFSTLHHCSLNKYYQLHPHFHFQKLQADLTTLSLSNLQTHLNKPMDLIFYDAFSPNKQPELWTQNIFSMLYDLLNKNGVLVTYCAQSKVKKTLKHCGFSVQALQGPPGKREITRAIKL